MVEPQFSDVELARLYDRFHPPESRADLAFYLPMVMSADSVLDVGCGTGALLQTARERGHTGRLVGLDPAPGMIEQARRRSDVEWVLGDLATSTWAEEFELGVMTGHAFQVLVDDAEIAMALRAIRSALRGGGRFAFETRNPLAREWESWTPDRITGVTTEDGAVVLMRQRVESVQGEIVRFATTFESSRWDEPKVSKSSLRFVDPGSLSGFLTEAGFVIETRFGDWDRQELSCSSPEIVTIAKRAQ